MRVVVIGGGIGGLSVAISLRRAGIDTTVPKRTAKLDAAGAGITLFANAIRGLEQLGVRDAVVECSAAARRVAILTRDGGTLLVLKLSRRGDKAGQLDGRLACGLRNTIVRLLPAAAQRRQLAPIVSAEL